MKKLEPKDCVSSTCNMLADMWIDRRNNFLTLERFAEHYGISPACARSLLNAGEIAQEQRATEYIAMNYTRHADARAQAAKEA